MVSLSFIFVNAQHGGMSQTPEERAKQKTERLAEYLSLSESQTTQVNAINLAYANKMKSLKEKSAQTEADRIAMKNLRTESSTAIKAILTPEQLTKFNERTDRKKEHGHHKGKEHGGDSGKADYKGKERSDYKGKTTIQKNNLEVTKYKGKAGKSASSEAKSKMTPQERAAKQTEKMTESLSLKPKQVKKISAINLTYAQKMEATRNASTDKEASRAAMKALKTEKSNAIKAVLKKEQLKKYMEKSDRKSHGIKGKSSKR